MGHNLKAVTVLTIFSDKLIDTEMNSQSAAAAQVSLIHCVHITKVAKCPLAFCEMTKSKYDEF